VGRTVCPLGRWGVDCMRDIFILNEMWMQGKIQALIAILK
jgi:hypothetical protein